MIGLSISIGSGQNGGQRSGNRSLTLSGLIDGAARPGSASGITAAFSDGFPIQSLSWGMTPGGTEFGTGASPQDFSSADTGLFDAPGLLHVTARAAGRSYSLSVPIRTAPPVFLTPPAFAAPLYKIGEAVEVSLGTVDAAPATLTVASFTLDGEDRQSGLAGLAWSSAGETAWGRAGVLRLQARAESSGGVVLSAPVTARLGDAPRAFSAADWSVDETGVRIAALPDDGNMPITNIRYRIDGGPDRSVNGVTDFALADYGDIQIRAVNALGIGAWSDTKTRIAQTPTLSIEAAPLLAEVAAVEGNTLTATAGPVSGGPSSRTWQWYRGTAAISGAIGESYMLQPADIGQRIKVRQIETPVGGSPVTRDSAVSPVVVALNFQAQDNGDGTFGITYADGARSTVEFVLSQPTVYAGSFNLDLAALETGPICLVQPALSGTPEPGATLSATPFFWVYPEALGALSVSSGWRRNGTVIAGATGSTHTVISADAGTDLQYIETGTQSGAAAPVTAASPAVRIGDAAPTSYSPQTSTSALAWWDASDEATITHEAGTVSQFADKIGTAHLTGSGTTGVSASEVNGLNSILLDGIGNYFERSATTLFPADGDWVLTIVASIDEVNHINDALVSAINGDNTFAIVGFNASEFAGRLAVSGEAVSFDGGPYGGLHVFQVKADLTGQATATAYVDGIPVAFVPYSAAVDATTLRFFRSYVMGGRFCEAFLDRDLSSQAAAFAYAASKWGIS
ncbi:hypothetical protein JMM61_13650 [Rhodovulum sulfidophilum]|uniref:hypothetical protein n=1 Tax=Rhodovulum sulfidophilum TaxID=35806 RepID=UPI0019281065|nr:hypothetical protein [Rhodovulum sulfidophilum]MBL3586422.1 hypothetical protein [Rhodovulum sulfidophilum]